MTRSSRREWELPRPEPADIALGLGLTAIVVIGVFRPDETVAYDLADGGSWLVVLCAVATVPLCWRRHYPLMVFGWATAITFSVAAAAWDTSLLPIVVLVAAYNLGAHAETRRSVAALAGGLVGTGVLFVIEAPFFDSVLGLAFPAEMVVVWSLGLVVALRERAAERARARLIQAEREAVLRSERAVLDERLRVARDLHDLVSSSLSAIAVQAAAVSRTGDAAPEVLRTIESTNQVALQDLRRLLRALRVPPSSDDGGLTGRGADEAELQASLARATGWTGPAEPIASTTAGTKRTVSWDRSVDLALGLTVVAINLVGSLAPDPSRTTEYDDPVLPLLVLLAAAPGLALIVRRTRPLTTLAIAFASLTTVTALGWQTGTLPAALLFALFSVGSWASPRRGLIALAAVAAAMVAMAVYDHGRFAEWVQWGSIAFVVPYLVGLVIGLRRRQGQRALDAAVAAEREVVRSAERAVAAERLAVARDLHDLVTHSLAAVAVLAGSASRTAPAETALVQIQNASRQALSDLRTMQGSLRSPDDEAHLAPAPGLQELAGLTALHGAVHGPVRLDVDEQVAGEAPSLRTTIFRIVQEALTNAGRHAPGAPVAVCVRHTDTGVSIDVQNEPPPPGTTADATGSGWGLVGMHERADLYGGTLVAGPTREGGFAVRAELLRTAPA